MAVDNGQRFEGYLGDRWPAQPQRNYGLTAVELANLRWLSHGLTQTDTAHVRGVTIDTVHDQIATAKAKLAAKSPAHAVAIALRHGLIA